MGDQRRGYSQSEHSETQSLRLSRELDKEDAIKVSLQVVAPVIHRYHPLPHPFRIAAMVHEKEKGFWKLVAWERAMNGQHAEERLLQRAAKHAEGSLVVTFLAIPGGFIRPLPRSFCVDCMDALLEAGVSRLLMLHREGWFSYPVGVEALALMEQEEEVVSSGEFDSIHD